VTEVAPGVSRLGTHIVNWYLVREDDSITAVDSGLPGYAGSLDADLRAAGLSRDQVRAVVLTHSDGDHTGLASRFKEAGARVLIHEADAATLVKPAPKKGDAAPAKLLRELRRPAAWRFMATWRAAAAASRPASSPTPPSPTATCSTYPGGRRCSTRRATRPATAPSCSRSAAYSS
jgi:glyoxylase-like metal-dependent hydrolase (beta-lactamase superfamily II)